MAGALLAFQQIVSNSLDAGLTAAIRIVTEFGLSYAVSKCHASQMVFKDGRCSWKIPACPQHLATAPATFPDCSLAGPKPL